MANYLTLNWAMMIYELGCLKIFADIVDQLYGSGWELTIHCLQITILTLTVWCLALKAWHWWRWDLTWIESSFLEFGIGLGLQLINSKTRKLLHFDWVFTCESCEHHIFVEVWDVSEPKNWNLGCWEHQVSMSRHKAGSFPGRLAKPHFWATLWGSAGFGSSDHHTDAEDIWGGVLQWSCWCFPFWLLRSTSTKNPWVNRPIVEAFGNLEMELAILRRLHPVVTGFGCYRTSTLMMSY